jgi:hypothetical protein
VARVRLVQRVFSSLCLAVLITFLFFHGIVSELSNLSELSKFGNRKNLGVSQTKTVTINTVIFSKNTALSSNLLSEFQTQDLSSTNHLGWRLKDYQPIALLDVRPVVLNNIQASLPAIFNDSYSQQIICLLMINEYGDVDKILFGDNQLSELQRNELEAMFLNLRFNPGIMQGLAVPTVMRIEIRI